MESINMHVRLIMLVVVAMVAGCATTPSAESARGQDSQAEPSTPVLRILDITPTDGTAVDSSTVIEVTVAYHVPDFDPERGYRLSAMFAGEEGGMFSRGPGPALLRSPAGVVTVQQPVGVLWTGDGSRATTPLTGSVFLFEFDLEPVSADTLRQGDRMLVRSSGVNRTRARTRTFHFNGAGPARTMGGGLPDVLEEYWTFRSHKAFALAYEAPARWTFGYSFGFGSAEDAVERALPCHSGSVAFRSARKRRSATLSSRISSASISESRSGSVPSRYVLRRSGCT